ncbi:hypothetical protein L1987_15363 [Smallanthus sonchifolius]|uniref:Uncharacterized protein n=1 Tax=Smallanthus sonchifolius TaxID=185202 RepID=A0ACB9J5W1_9ASTR|nr:hypothetical protein L1987_15363 [Smallanthus sonchifolius]
MNGLGLGTNAIPPPVSGKFINGLVDIDLTCLHESSGKDDSPNKDDSSSKADSASNEEFFTASDDGSDSTCPEGVVSEELLSEQKVKKNIITNSDNCHILVNCPSENQRKRHIVSQPAVIPKSPPVKHPKSPKENVLKPPVKPMVKPKITSKAKPYVSRKGKQPAIPCVSTSGSTPTGEKFVVKLSKPQRRRRIKRLRKLEQLTGVQSVEASISSPAVVEPMSTVLVKKQKRSWIAKSKSSQSSSPNSSKDSPILNSHDCGYVVFAGEKGGSITCQGVVSNDCVSFDNVNFCEQLKLNLLSVSQMCDKEYSVMFDKNECLILKPGFEVPEDWILMRAPRTNDTCQIDISMATTTSSVATCLLTKATELDSILWHRKLGHISYRKMNHLVRNGLVTGVPKLIFTVADDCTKDETADIHQYLILSLESLYKLKVRRIRSDNGNEFKNNLMELFCPKKGIHHEFSAPYTSQQNGVAEQKNRTLIETARTMLSDAKLPVTFWAEAVNTACHVLNKVLVVKRHNKICYELINNRLPNLDYLVPFGSPCSLLLQYKDRKSMFHAKAVEGIFLRYVANSPCKRVYNIGTRTVEEWFEVDCSKHSIPPEPTGPAWGFDYDALFKSFNLLDLSAVDAANVYELFGGGDDSSFSTRATVPIVTPDSNAASTSGTHDSDNSEDVHVDGDDVQANPNTSVGNDAPADPINIESSSSGTQDMGEGVQPIGTRWVFKCKTDDRHVVVKNKARLVVYQLDVKSAFLYEKVHEEVYVTQHPGFEDPHNINKVYKLDKALYGLHQAPRAWYETLSKHLLSNGFDRGQIDSTLFIRKEGGDILLVQVMKSKFEMSNMGELSFFMGLQVSQREDGIYLHQTKYVQDILSKYKMNDSSTYGTHIPVNHGLHPDKDGKDVDCRLYSGMIGSLMYLTASRPDIMFAVCLCSRFQSQPKESHMIHVKRIFRYLKGKPRLGLWYSKQQSFDFKSYTDSDYGDCNLARKSISGGCQFLGDRLVSWQCKKQSTVSVSTCEAEYIASASGCSQILWIQQQLRDYGLNLTGTPQFIDNNATMSITNNPVKHSKTKHIEIRHRFIHDCAEKHLTELVKVHTDDNLADFSLRRLTDPVLSILST